MIPNRILSRTRSIFRRAVERLQFRLPTGATARSGMIRRLDLCELEERVMYSASPVMMVVDPDVIDVQAADGEMLETLVTVTAEDLAGLPDGSETSPNERPVDSEPSNDDAGTDDSWRRELVFVDTATEEYEQLVDDLLSNADPSREFDVILLDAGLGGIEQISGVLAAYDDVDALHVVSHGSDGQVKLGNTWLSNDNLDAYAGEIAGWNNSLRDGADLLIYGCDVASTADGRALTEALGALCDCDVAASVDDTGHFALGGNWELEHLTGMLETGVIFEATTLTNWTHILGTVDAVIPGPQNTTEGGTLVFSTGNANTITVDDGTAADPVLYTSLSVNDGVLTLSTTAGLTFQNGADGTSSMTVSGLESAINTAFDGLSYTPTPAYTGPAALVVSVDELQSDPTAIYTFDNPSDLGSDGSSGGTNDGTVNGATSTFDATRGNVLSLDGVNDFVQIPGLITAGSQRVTLASWVNMQAGSDQHVVSLGDNVGLILDGSVGAGGVTGRHWDGGTQLHNISGIDVVGSGWRHVAYTIDAVANTQSLYLDGVEVDPGFYIPNISYTLGVDTFLGKHGDGGANHFNGLLDDVRIYDRSLSSGEVADLFAGVSSDTENVSITVQPVNNDPMITSNGGGPTAAVNVAENTTAVTTVTATDAEAPPQVLAYSIVPGGDGALFTIDGSSGALSFMSAPDFEAPADMGMNNVYDVTVQVSDSVGGTDTQAISVTVTDTTESDLWITTADDVGSPSSAPGLDSWMAGEILSFDDPNLTFDPTGSPANTTDGTFSSIANFDNLVQDSDARLSGLHYVQSNITVGSGANDFALIAGDVLFSLHDSETLQSNNTLSVTDQDLVVFRPDTPGDYTVGTFTLLLDGSQIPEMSLGLHGLTLVESNTTVGSSLISAGTFLLVDADDPDVFHYTADGVGAGTTSGTWTTLIDGSDINIDQFPRGIDLVETTTEIGGTTLSAGTILLSLNFGDPTVGDNSVAAERQDIFYLTVSKTEWDQPTTLADATLFLDGGDVGLDTANERMHGFTLLPSGVNQPPTITSDLGGPTAAVNVAENTTAVTTVTATDAEAPPQVLAYSIVPGGDGALFTIDGSSGALSFMSAPDYEMPTDMGMDNVYDVTVQVSDGVGGTDTQAISVTVTDVGELTSPCGPEHQINTFTTNAQSTPSENRQSIAVDADGDYVVVWQSWAQDGDSFGVYGQRFNADGVPQGAEFPVNTFATSNQRRAAVAMDADGDFVVVWDSFGQDGSGSGIYGQRYSAAGVPQGGEFPINTETTNEQVYASVAMDDAGNFVVTWSSMDQDGDSMGIFAQRFTAGGAPLGEFPVNTYTTSLQSNSTVAMDADGDFVIVWASLGQDGDQRGIYAQRYNSAGMPQGGEIPVNTTTADSQDRPSVAMDDDGDFVVTWSSYSPISSSWAIHGQRFNASGVAQGGEFIVNTTVADDQHYSSVVMDANGKFAVTWTSEGQDGDSATESNVYVREYQADGTAVGGERLVNTTTSGNQRYASIGMDDAGEFVVVWSGNGVGDSAGVYGQRFHATCPNNLPTAVHGGPYVINEGDGVTFDASGSTDPDGDPLTYNWDLDGDGMFDDAVGATLMLDWFTLGLMGFDDDGMTTIGVEVDDGLGGVDSATTSFTINNVAPSIGVNGTGSVSSGDSYMVTLSAVDPGNDTVTSWTINWGDGTIETIPGNPTSASHVYNVGGLVQHITASVTDEDGTFFDAELLVPGQGSDAVFRYEGTTGAFLQQVGSAADGMTWAVDAFVGDDGNIYVAGHLTHNILRYDEASGAFVDVFIPGGSGGLNRPTQTLYSRDGDLLVLGFLGNNIIRYDAATGAPLGEFVTAGSGGLSGAAHAAYGPDGHLYVSSHFTNEILRYDGNSGTFIDDFVTVGSGGVDRPSGLTFGPDGHLHVASFLTSEVLKYDGTTGAFLGAFIGTGGGLAGPVSIAFGPDGNAYVTDQSLDSVRRYDGTSGAYVDDYVTPSSGGLDAPDYHSFRPDHQVTVVANQQPTTSGIADVSIVENTTSSTVDLFAAFADAEDADSDLVYALQNNTNPALFASTPIDGVAGTLTLDYAANAYGTADLTVRATDTGGLFVETTFTVNVNAANRIWLSTEDDVSGPSGAPGLNSWTDGEVLEFGGPTLALEPGTTSGTFSSVFNLDGFAADGNADVDALHYVTTNITVGSANSIALQPGDVLFSTADDETLTSSNSLGFEDEDVVLFRPDTPGDYSAGTFSVVLDFNSPLALLEPLLNLSDVWAITLVEANTTVGDTLLQAGDFLFTRQGGAEDNDIYLFETTDVGAGTTDGNARLLVEGSEVDVSNKIYGLELIEAATTVGGTTLPAGTILLTLDNNESDVGNNLIPVTEHDIFRLDLTTTTLGPTGTAAGTATLVFEGIDVGLDDGKELLDAITLVAQPDLPNSPPSADAGGPYVIDEGTGVTLDASGSSDPDGDTLAYNWDLDGDGVYADGNGQTLPLTWMMLDAAGISDDGTYNIGVEINDGRGNVVTDVTTLTVNNVAPTANPDGGVGFTSDEDTAFTTSDVTANDSDPNPNDTFAIVAVDTTGTIGLVIDNGDGTFDYDPNGQFESLGTGDSTTDSFTYTLQDDDGAISFGTVTITINGVNDDPFITSPGAVDVPENSTFVLTVTATDVEGDPVMFSITGGADGTLFSIDANSGDLTFDAAPNFENATDADLDNVYKVKVTASDGMGGAFSRLISVTVTDQNEAPTDLSLDNTSVNENAAGAVVGNVSVADSDAGDSHSYGVDDVRFEVVAGQLKLKAGQSLDFESESTVNLTLTATDSGGLMYNEGFVITVTDQNEPPTDLSLDNTTVSENAAGAVVGNVSVVDPDAGDSHTVTIDDLRFEVVAGQLKLKAGQSLDYESESTVNLTLTATDSGGLTYNEAIVVTVTDQNEAPTDLSLDNNTVAENAAGAVVGNVSVADPDAGDSHTYSVDDVRFEIVSGQLKLKAGQSLDYESEPTVNLTLTATDSGGLMYNEGFVITVADVFETVPIIVPPSPPAPPPAPPPTDDTTDPDEIVEEEEPTDEETDSPAETQLPDGSPGDPGGLDRGVTSAVRSPSPSTDFVGGIETAFSFADDELLDRSSRSTESRSLERASHADEAELPVIVDFSRPSDDLWNDLAQMEEEMKASGGFEAIVTGTATVMASSLTAGYVLWIIRGGFLLTSLLAQMPAWRFIDPLPILAYLGQDEEDSEDERDKHLNDMFDERADVHPRQ